MTLEESNQLALRAAEKDDVEGIRLALEARAKAIRNLADAQPSEELAGRLRAAIEAGEDLHRGLLAIKYRLGLKSARLAQIRTGLAAGAPVRRPAVDCRG